MATRKNTTVTVSFPKSKTQLTDELSTNGIFGDAAKKIVASAEKHVVRLAAAARRKLLAEVPTTPAALSGMKVYLSTRSGNGYDEYYGAHRYMRTTSNRYTYNNATSICANFSNEIKAYFPSIETTRGASAYAVLKVLLKNHKLSEMNDQIEEILKRFTREQQVKFCQHVPEVTELLFGKGAKITKLRGKMIIAISV